MRNPVSKNKADNLCGTGPKVVNDLHTCVCTYACIHTPHTLGDQKDVHVRTHRNTHTELGEIHTHGDGRERERERHLEHRRQVNQKNLF